MKMTNKADNSIFTSFIESANYEGEKISGVFFKKNTDLIVNASEIIANSISSGGKLLICGNGGSATDGEHFAAELVNRFLIERRAYAAISLNTAPAVMTSIANDRDYSEVFSRQIEALGKPGDVLFGISTSGKSPNIVRAAEQARKMDLTTICLLGNKGGLLKEYSHIALVVETDLTPRIQEVHIRTIHILCELIEELLQKT